MQPIRASIKPGEGLEAVIKGNVRAAASTLVAKSAVLRGAYFDIGSGQVSWL